MPGSNPGAYKVTKVSPSGKASAKPKKAKGKRKKITTKNKPADQKPPERKIYGAD